MMDEDVVICAIFTSIWNIDLIVLFDHVSIDDSEMSEVPTVSNVRQDLSEWQEKHAYLVLSTVKVNFASFVFPHVGKFVTLLWNVPEQFSHKCNSFSFCCFAREKLI